MSRTRLIAWMGALILATLLGLLGTLQMALAQDGSQSAQTDSTGNEQTPVEQTEEFILDETDGLEESPDRFIPTEEISQDLGVSFPVDI